MHFNLPRSYKDTKTYVSHRDHQTTTAGAADFAVMARIVNYMVLVV